MKKFILSVCAVLLFAPLFVAAQGLAPKGPLPRVQSSTDLDAVKRERDRKISEIEAPVRDLDAREFARQVQQGIISMGELEQASSQWLGLPEENAALVALIRKYANGPKVPALTPEELDALDENKRQVQLFLNNGRKNPAAARLAAINRQITQLEKPVFELDARYWAWRVTKVKDTTLEELEEYSQNWYGERSYNRKLINKIRENINTGNTKPLTKKEEKKLDQVKAQVRALLNTL